MKYNRWTFTLFKIERLDSFIHRTTFCWVDYHEYRATVGMASTMNRARTCPHGTCVLVGSRLRSLTEWIALWFVWKPTVLCYFRKVTGQPEKLLWRIMVDVSYLLRPSPPAPCPFFFSIVAILRALNITIISVLSSGKCGHSFFVNVDF